MSLVLYDTYSKKERPFTPANGKQVSMYTCGPTVYGRPHIGNYSSFLMADLLRRWLQFGLGYAVNHVKNITDVGHLVADRDEGEDKIEKQAREEFGQVSMQSVIGIARKYEEQYLEDERTLNCIEPEHRPRATDYISQMRDMVEFLWKEGIAYDTGDGIYFDVSKFPAYGKLSGNKMETLEGGHHRVALNKEKENAADFALWKFCVGKNESHILRWTSPRHPDGTATPEGFPGWHIECSAMSRALLGDQLDIHTGGEDNIFPHHECEIAQSESVTKKSPFVGLWLHKRRIDLDGEKMSKSLGNVLTIPHILEKGFDAMDLRYYLLSVHYRTNLKFSWKGMEDAKKARKKIMEWMPEKIDTSMIVKNSSAEKNNQLDEALAHQKIFIDAMNADLNTSAALAAIFDVMNWSRQQKNQSAETAEAIDHLKKIISETFGCFEPKKEEGIPADIQALVDARATARTEKNFAESDRLRDEIAKRGYEVRDTGGGQGVRKL